MRLHSQKNIKLSCIYFKQLEVLKNKYDILFVLILSVVCLIVKSGFVCALVAGKYRKLT